MYTPMSLTIRRRISRWGNSFGIRVTKKEAARLGVKEGEEVELELFEPRNESELDRLALFDFGGDYDIDEILGEEMGGDR